MVHKEIIPAVYAMKKVVERRGKKLKDAIWEYRCDHCDRIIEDRHTIFYLGVPKVEEIEWTDRVERNLKRSSRDMLEFCTPEHGAQYVKSLVEEFKVEFRFGFWTGITPGQMKKFAKEYTKEEEKIK